MTSAQIQFVQLKLKFYIFMHARCRFIRIFQLVIVHVFQMYSCMTIECILVPSSSRVGRVHSALVARQDDGQRDGRDGVLGQDGPDAAHECVGIPHDTSHARGHRQRARRRRDENLACKCRDSEVASCDGM